MQTMNSKNVDVMRKILYAVETGGHVYGQMNYADFTEAYTNGPDEHAITIGAGQWYASEAQRLLKLIFQTDEALWKSIDKAGLLNDIENGDWSCYNITCVSQKAETIVKMISSTVGIKCQDTLIAMQIQEYEKLIQDKYNITNTFAIMEWINIFHQGGESAVIRLMQKVSDENNIGSIYTAMLSDTGNQVGAYRSRQLAVYNMILEYAIEEGVEEMSKGAFKAVELAISREGKNQYTQSVKREQVFSGFSDCSSLWWKSYEKAYNIQIGTWTGEQVDRGTRVALYSGKSTLNEADYKKMQVGDLIFFGSGEAKHVEGFAGWKNGTPMLFGHGSGTPSYKNGLTYRHSAGYYQVRRYYTETQTDNSNSVDGRTTALYPARMTKNVAAYTWAGTGSTRSKTYPTIKKDTLVDVMDYTQKDSAGKEWYFVRLCHPTEGFVSVFVPTGSFRHLK